MRRLLTTLMLCSLCTTLSAQGGIGTFVRKLGTLIDSMSVSGLDRRYIDSPEKPWQVIVRAKSHQSIVKMQTSGSIDGIDYAASPLLQTKPSQYLGLWVGYRGYGLGYTFNVGSDQGAHLTFGATGGAYGVNVRIHRFHNRHPYFNLNSDIIPEAEKESWEKVELQEPIKVYSFIADAYYLLNGKRFSHAAAYDQSVIQKRSAGSLMVGAMYYYGRTSYANHVNGDLIYLMHGLGRVKLWQGSLGVGYAYNWVPASGLLVNAMVMPMLTVVNRIKCYGYTTNVEELMGHPNFLDSDISDEEWDKWWYNGLRISPAGEESYNSGMTLNFDARLSLTYNFGRYFINAYGQFNTFRYRLDSSHGRLSDWLINASFGVRL